MNHYEIERLADALFPCDCAECDDARNERVIADVELFFDSAAYSRRVHENRNSLD